MQVNNIQLTNPNFGMAITSTTRAKYIMEEMLSLKNAKKLQKLIQSEKNNPENIFITTEQKYQFDFTKGCSKCENLEVIVGDRLYQPIDYFIYLFSPGKAIISAIKDAIKYTQKISKAKKINEEINDALKDLVLKN